MSLILVIEDQPELLDDIVDQLRFEGYNAIGAANGRIGVEMARQHLPDLVLSDIMMPELDGFGVLSELRADPSIAAIPFIFLSARAEPNDRRKGLEAGADAYLTKPFTQVDLLAAIDKALSNRCLDE
ncbi:MAG: response regulator [Anaerolineae bacterium]|nr:response regulator [Anaerolineae bacterium]